MTGNDVCVLDTSIIVQVLRNNTVVGKKLDGMSKVFVPLTAVGELLFGAYKSPRLIIHLQRTEKFLAKCVLLNPDRFTAEEYAKVKLALERKGKRIPENDIWIAATAIQHSLPLYENDKHFREVDGLQLFNPLSSI